LHLNKGDRFFHYDSIQASFASIEEKIIFQVLIYPATDRRSGHRMAQKVHFLDNLLDIRKKIVEKTLRCLEKSMFQHYNIINNL